MHHIHRMLPLILLAAITLVALPNANARGWDRVEDENGEYYYRMEITVHPVGQSMPALKHRLAPDPLDIKDRNAAVYLLRANGFFEQHSAFRRLQELQTQYHEEAQAAGEDRYPPYIWLNMPPEDLPLEEVKKYLSLLSFQPRDLKAAARCEYLDFEHNIDKADNPITMLLPEVQAMREIARMQTLRAKVAIAEGRLEDAHEIMLQTYMMGRLVGRDGECLVQWLVGLAIIGIANWDMTIEYIQQPDAPNLYWPIAVMPKPFCDGSRAMALEYHFIDLTFKSLFDIKDTPMSVSECRVMCDRFVENLELAGYEIGRNGIMEPLRNPDMQDAALAVFTADGYPGARRYLIEDWDMSPSVLDQMPVAQVVGLAARRFAEEARDHVFKWQHIPLRSGGRGRGDDEWYQKGKRLGAAAIPTNLMLPAVRAATIAGVRTERDLAIIQAVEAIRMYMAENDGAFPNSLDDLPVPVMNDPFDGKPFGYRLEDGAAILSTDRKASTMPLELTIRAAK